MVILYVRFSARFYGVLVRLRGAGARARFSFPFYLFATARHTVSAVYGFSLVGRSPLINLLRLPVSSPHFTP